MARFILIIMDVKIREHISISPINGMERRVKLIHSLFCPELDRIEILYGIDYCNNGEVIKGIKGYERGFVIDKYHMVDDSGNVVTEGGEKTEYDFYTDAINAGLNYFDLHRQAIHLLDNNKRFD